MGGLDLGNIDDTAFTTVEAWREAQRAIRPTRLECDPVTGPPIGACRRPAHADEIGAIGTDAPGELLQRGLDVSGDPLAARIDEPHRDAGHDVLEHRTAAQRDRAPMQ